MCALTAPRYFDQAPTDGHVILLIEDVEPDHAQDVLESIELCPSGALSLADAKGDQRH